MKNVLTIFIKDIGKLSKRFFAMAIIIAILIIPALYAWFNIYANWDPYGNTGNIKIAVASDDKGYNDLDGKYVNKGETVLEELSKKDSIDFVVYEDSNEALRAMESGECYGAIILQPDFTKHMYDLASALAEPEGTITFYENFKLNAVADKITETAASTVSQTVQTEYLEVLFDTLFGKVSDVVDEVDFEETGNKLIDVLMKLRQTTRDVSAALTNFMNSSSGVAGKLQGISTADTVEFIYSVDSGVNGAGETIESVRESYRERSREASDIITEILELLGEKQQQNGEFSAEEVAALKNDLMLLETYGKDVTSVSTTLGEEFSGYASGLLNSTDAISAEGDTSPVYLLEVMKGDLRNMQKLQDEQINNAIEQLFSGIINLSNGLNPVLLSLASTVSDVDPTMQSAAQTIYALNDSIVYLRDAMDTLSETLDRLLEKAEDLQDSDTLNTLINMLGGDSEKFAEFFACPVTVRTETLYPVADYGTAMTPFYSTLAIWVGCVVLAAIIKVEAEPRGLKNVTENQLYWARFLLYLLLNEIQTLVIVLGDLYLLGVSCIDPFRFWLASAICSLVFTFFIYSMVLAFGDIGKAIIVVIMVLQIAGSSGTYPIEILEGIFSRLYLFFPFPYAINAMREAICGFYRYDYWKYLGELMIFGVLGALIGIYVRRPFIKINAYVEEEMEETGIL